MSKTKSKQRNAMTQTRNKDPMLEIAHLQEQVRLLTLENDHLRKYIAEEVTAISKTTPTITVTHSNNIAETPKPIESTRTNIKSQGERKKSASMRGCNCKKNCSSKLCGCAKKNMPCGELCRCKNCQNQEKNNSEQNKEHLENSETAKVKKDKQIINKNFKNVTAHKSVFSPDTKIHSSTPNIEEYKLPTLQFGNSKRLTFRSDEEDEMQEESKENSKHPKRRGRLSKNSLEVNNTNTRKQRSTSNEEKKYHREKNTEEQGLRRSRSNEIGTLTDDILKDIDKRTNKYLQNIEHGMVTLRSNRRKEHLDGDKQAQKNNASSDSGEIKDVSMENNKKEIAQHLSNETSKSVTREEAETSKIQKHNKSGSSEISNDSFNPMKPRNEIPRTPVSGNTSRKTGEESTFLKEFYQAEIDWEKYQAQLIGCNNCTRKFHPDRIKKHQACCKKL